MAQRGGQPIGCWLKASGKLPVRRPMAIASDHIKRGGEEMTDRANRHSHPGEKDWRG